MTKTLTVKTKKAEGQPQVETQLTVDLGNLSPDHILSYALDAIVVKWQGGLRRSKTITEIPATATYLVPIPGTRQAADPQQAARSLSVEQLEAILKEKQKTITVLRKGEGK